MKPTGNLLLHAALAILVVMAPSCASTRTGGDVKSSNNAKTLTLDEWNQFAVEILSTVEGRLNLYRNDGSRTRQGPIVLAIGDFKNKTSQPLANFSTTKDVMYGQIRKVLVNSGLVSVNMDMAGGGGDVDTLLGQIDSLRNSGEYDQSTTTQAGSAQAPELILWGDIISINFKDGRKSNFEYALNLRLINTSTRLTIFEEQVQLKKQYIKGFFG